MLGFKFNWRNKGTLAEQPETAPFHVRPNGTMYINADEMFASKQGQRLLAELKGWDPTKPLSERPHDLEQARRRARDRTRPRRARRRLYHKRTRSASD